MRYLMTGLTLVVLACTACAPGGGATATEPTAVTPTPIPWPTPWPEQERAKTYALIHLWYRSGADTCPSTDSPRTHWGPWIWSTYTDDPCITIPGAPWLRQISSNAYPLIGAYDSRNPEVLRWQIRQAKAAGIDGFFVSLYSWAPHLQYLTDIFFGTGTTKGMLQIAHEENFTLGIEGWGAEDLDGAWREEIMRHLARIEASPYRDAYIYIDGRPAYWLMYPYYMSEGELAAFLDQRPVTWIFRSAELATLVRLNTQMTRSRAQYPSGFNFPEADGWDIRGRFNGDLAETQLHSDIGMHPIATAYMGYDERFGERPGPYIGRHGLREGTIIMRQFLEESVARGAKIILMESWNEWGEGSMLEAGINISPWRQKGQEPDLYRDEYGADAPYLYLDALRRFNGMREWVPPQMPPCSALDPLIRERSRSGPPETRCLGE